MVLRTWEAVGMFTRIRYTAKVLSASKINPYDEPDIAFEEESTEEASPVSKAVGSLVGILAISLAVGIIGAPLVARLLPVQGNTATVTGVIAASLAILLDHLRGRITARLGQRVAPYFGHRIARTVRTIRG